MTMLVGFHLLDRQIVDVAGQLAGKVDDVELGTGEDGKPYVAALLVGPQALGPRINGRLGRLITTIARRLQLGEPSGPIRIPYEHVGDVNSAVNLTIRRELLPEPALEVWLREHVIGRLPGAGDAGD
jgi:sporulation protein YlmC with PRC-barrel domain